MGLCGGSYGCPANSKLRSHFKVMGLCRRDMAVLQTSVLLIWKNLEMNIVTQYQVSASGPSGPRGFFYFSTKTYDVGTQKNRLDEMVLLSTQNTCLNR